MVKQAIITDAGLASRFLPIVKTIPKSFIPIGSKPIMQILIEECVEADIGRIILVAREETRQVYEDYFTNNCEWLNEELALLGKTERFAPVQEVLDLPEIEIIVQDKNLPYGTAAPVLSAKPYLAQGEPFLLLQGDDVVFAKKRDAQILVEEFQKGENYAGYMMAQHHEFEGRSAIGMIKVRDGTDDELDYIVEKPLKKDSPSSLGSYGRFLYTFKIFDYMNDTRLGVGGELWNVDALTAMAQDHPVKVVRNMGQWITTGDPHNYLKAQIMAGLEGKNSDELKEFVQSLL
jgi:UTP--glucose-1-phosphate uridylyltransferase